MKRNIILIISLFISSLSLFVSSCQREIDNPGGTTITTPVNDNIMVVAGIRGTVVDENNQPVGGATVTSGNSTTVTDRYGVFKFSNINLAKENGYVKVIKSGYFTGSRTFVTTAGRIHNVRIKLIPKIVSGTFAAAAGGTITINGGGKLVMPATAVTDANGNVYTGSVNVAMTWIDPTAANLPEIIVGDLRGLTTAGEERALQTYGMLGVEMTSATGQSLKIATGKTAELTFPVPATIAGTAPATIDLWHFDEVKGRWMQEGTATKIGNIYIAQVSHFSFWNCDAPFPLIKLCMTLLNAANNQPLINVQVMIRRANGSVGSGRTDSIGRLCGKVPKNEALILEVLDQCNTVAFTQNIGPFGIDTDMGNVQVALPGPSTLVITGTVTNCANVNVTNGVVVIYTENSNSYSVPLTNGSFSFTLIRCGSSSTNFAVKGIDLSTLQESVLYNGTGTNGTVNIGTLQACGNSISEFIEYIVDGVPYMWADLGQPNTIEAYDSSSAGLYTTRTVIYGQYVTNGNAETTYFEFYNNQSVGTYPIFGNLNNIKITNPSGTFYLVEVVTPNPMMNITTFGPVSTGYIEGNFNLMIKNPSPNSTQNVICTFKVKR